MTKIRGSGRLRANQKATPTNRPNITACAIAQASVDGSTKSSNKSTPASMAKWKKYDVLRGVVRTSENV
jgi:hypothetical protein